MLVTRLLTGWFVMVICRGYVMFNKQAGCFITFKAQGAVLAVNFDVRRKLQLTGNFATPTSATPTLTTPSFTIPIDIISIALGVTK